MGCEFQLYYSTVAAALVVAVVMLMILISATADAAVPIFVDVWCHLKKKNTSQGCNSQKYREAVKHYSIEKECSAPAKALLFTAEHFSMTVVFGCY